MFEFFRHNPGACDVLLPLEQTGYLGELFHSIRAAFITAEELLPYS